MCTFGTIGCQILRLNAPNSIFAGAPSQTPLGEHTVLPQTSWPYLRGRTYKEREGNGREGKDLPYQRQSASYAPDDSRTDTVRSEEGSSEQPAATDPRESLVVVDRLMLTLQGEILLPRLTCNQCSHSKRLFFWGGESLPPKKSNFPKAAAKLCAQFFSTVAINYRNISRKNSVNGR